MTYKNTSPPACPNNLTPIKVNTNVGTIKPKSPYALQAQI
jgi:hypothetical protein